MNGTLMGHRAVVTGAVQGIGFAIASRLAASGATLVLVDRNAEALPAAAEAIEGATFLAVDLTDPEAAQQVTNVARAADILVNNAGIAGSQPVGDLDPERWDVTLQVNPTAAFRLCRALVPDMAARGLGRVINISSMMGVGGYRGNSDYAVSKAGLIALTQSIAADYGHGGVTASAIAPGPIMTDLARGIIGRQPAWYRRSVVANKPIQRDGHVEDIAAAAQFLASEEAGFITGQVLAVDGGLTSTRYVSDRYPEEQVPGSPSKEWSIGRATPNSKLTK